MTLAEVSGLGVSFGRIRAVDDVSFTVAAGEMLGLVGASGSGKSVTALALMGLVKPDRGTITGQGRRAIVFQNARRALNPTRTIGRQLADVLGSPVRVGDMLRRVGLSPDRADAYPFELSGGMCQRVMIALALATDPALLIADEPTTGLDTTVQATILDLIADLARERGMGTILITHDLALAAQRCDRIALLEGGRLVRIVLPGDLPPRPVASPQAAAPGSTLLRVDGLAKHYGKLRAVDGVDLVVREGEALGLVGESGCGKSTLAAMLARLIDPTAGRIEFAGEDIAAVPARRAAAAAWRGRLQMVVQDAGDSLDPRLTAAEAVAAPLRRLCRLSGAALHARVAELFDRVHLPRALHDRLPYQLSGGQQARVGIARALAPGPGFVILDEPTAALDAALQDAIMRLLDDLRRDLGVAYLLISHDLDVIRQLCGRVMVMQAGRIVEAGPVAEVFARPAHPHTAGLIAAIPQGRALRP
ncbi:MAG: ABC transporter ATP-binding protein [Alphaproteobacteria bacterium]|jgi:peptide/nickel transport system ATP-binding protein|nr:ABC transporter ATP-binding protein [Alphaproteobacteria bacterium]